MQQVKNTAQNGAYFICTETPIELRQIFTLANTREQKNKGRGVAFKADFQNVDLGYTG